MLSRFAWGTLLLVVSCSSAPTRPAPATDGGLNLNLRPATCPDAGALLMADAGACTSLKPRDFTRDVVPLFNSCAGEVCHSFNAGQIAEQVGVPADECCNEIQMIEPGHPERSYVLQKLIGRNLCAGSQMPLERSAFNPADIQTVSDWICQGARTTP
jgi:hypothetical protein